MKKRTALLCAAVLLLGCFGWNVSAADDMKTEFQKVRANIVEYLLDREYADTSEETRKLYQTRVDGFVKQAQELSESMDKSATAQSPWEDTAADPGTNFDRLTTMAKAYVMDGSSMQGNAALFADIISGMETVYLNQYNENTAEIGNWWSWEVGYAKKSAQLVALMFDYLSGEQVERYLRGVRRFCPDTRLNNYNNGGLVSTGANRTDVCYSIIIESALKEDEARLRDALEASLEVLEYVTEGDGFYEDGSFVQHTTVAYTYSYGDALINSLSLNLSFAGGTAFNVTDNPLLDNLYNAISASYEPLLYRGAAFDMVRGRAVSRSSDSHANAQSVTTSILRICDFAPEEYAAHFKSLLKYHVQNNSVSDYTETTNIGNRVKMQNILNDDSIEPIAEPVYNKIFNGMDRVAHFRPGWAAGLAMSSSRISSYESINDENIKGWYQGEGALYLYNSDETQYDTSFWATIDPYRYPGTTVSRKERADASNGKGGTGLSTRDWVGSAGMDGLYSVSGMELEGYDNTLSAKKSWFMFDDEIVCLGADITANDNAPVETTVENRKLSDAGNNVVTINGYELLTSFDSEITTPNVTRAHMEGNTDGADIGYYFPNGATMNSIRETRQHNIQEINPTQTSKVYNNTFFTFWMDHGTNPKGASYAYVVLPGMTAEETDEYAENPGITILENSAEAQAVRDENLHITGINFWQEKTKTVDGVTSNTMASVMLKQTETELTVTICDPTREQKSDIELTMADEGYRVVSADDGINVKQNDGMLTISADVYRAYGKNFTVTFEKTAAGGEGGTDSRFTNGIVLLEGSPNALVKGEKTLIDAADLSVVPGQKNDRVYVPLRFLAESLGAEVAWNDENGVATVTYGKTEMTADANSGAIFVGGTAVAGEAFMNGGRMMVPVRAVSEALNKKVYWHSKGLIVVGNSEKLFNPATEETLIDTLIGQILE